MNSQRALIIVILIFGLNSLQTVYADENRWSCNGPYDARIQTIAINPQDRQNILVGTVENGIYKTIDGGQTWGHIQDNILPTTIRMLQFHPLAPETVYVSTVQGFYKSANGGESWQLIQLPNGWQFEIRAFVVHPRLPHIIFIDGGFLGTNYKSTDGGLTWNELSMPAASPIAFRFNPLNDSVLFVGTQSAPWQKSVFKSTDLGETWTNVHNDLSTDVIGYNLAVDPVDTNIIYFCGRNRADINGCCLCKSINSGESWIDITPSAISLAHIFSVTVSPEDNNVVYICTRQNGVLKSADGGATWSEINGGIAGRFANIIEIDTVDGYLYLGTYYDGIYRSLDNGSSWEKISNNINASGCLSICICPEEGNQGFVTAMSTLYQTSDGCQTWGPVATEIPNGLSMAQVIRWDPLYTNYIYVGISIREENSDYYGVLVSSDHGQSWERFTSGLPDNTSITDIELTENETGARRILALVESGLYFSDDFGETWEHMDGLAPPDRLYDMAAGGPAPQNLFASDIANNMYKSEDYGESWQQLDIPDSGELVYEILCDPVSPEIVYICKIGGGLFKSSDSGINWQEITNDIPHDNGNYYISGLAVNPFNSLNMFISSSHYGVFQSHNGGQSWEAFNEGLDMTCPSGKIIFAPQDTTKLYFATLGRSVWTITRTPTGIEDGDGALPAQFATAAYPNPFNAAANISFTLPIASNVKLDIYDPLGRRTANLLDSYLPAGNHSLLWHPEDIAAGVYIYRLTTDNQQKSQKITLLK